MVHLSCGVQCTRAMLFALNVVLLVIGVSVMGLGVYLKCSANLSAISDIYGVSEALGSEGMQSVGVGMMIAGIATAALGAFGSLGAVYQHRCFLYTYSIFLTLIILSEFAGVITILIFRNKLWQSYDSGFMETFRHAYSQNQTETIKMIENLERQFQCCGVDGPSDYSKYDYPISKSCYPHQSTMFHPYDRGCATVVTSWVWNNLPIIAGILGGFLFIEIFGVISSLVIGVAISHSVRAEYYETLN